MVSKLKLPSEINNGVSAVISSEHFNLTNFAMFLEFMIQSTSDRCICNSRENSDWWRVLIRLLGVLNMNKITKVTELTLTFLSVADARGGGAKGAAAHTNIT